jgi:hypothetical protein
VSILVSIIVFLHSSRFGIVGPTLGISCEAASWPGLVSCIPLFDVAARSLHLTAPSDVFPTTRLARRVAPPFAGVTIVARAIQRK